MFSLSSTIIFRLPFCRYLFIALIALTASFNLYAHNVVAGAYVDGMEIEGEIGLSNGETALPGVIVEIFDSQDNKIGQTVIEADGLFSFTAIKAEQHVIKANLGAGHIAHIVVEADEFALPSEGDNNVAARVTNMSDTASNSASSTASQSPHAVNGVSAEELESIVRKAVSQQVRPLQKELRAYKEKVGMRDIAGGLGFIFGLFGVAAWMSSRKRIKQEAS